MVKEFNIGTMRVELAVFTADDEIKLTKYISEWQDAFVRVYINAIGGYIIAWDKDGVQYTWDIDTINFDTIGRAA